MRENDIRRRNSGRESERLSSKLGLVALAAGLAGLAPGLAEAASLPTCAQLGTSSNYGLVGNSQIISGTVISTIVPAAAAVAANPPSLPTPTPATPAFCRVSFTYSSGLSGPADGYDIGQTQKIQIQIVLPLNTADGGVTGGIPNSLDRGSVAKTVQGNWLGKVLVSASPGSSGTLTSTALIEGLNSAAGFSSYPIRLGYIGSLTDTGQHNPPWVLIPTGTLANTFDLGTIADWTHRGTHYGKQWAITLAQTYYGKSPTRIYYNGASGGGNMGMGQLMNYGDEYDGFLIAAPGFYWNQFTLAFTWPYAVFKKMVQQGGAMPTTSQEAALTAAVFAACDGLDGVVDGIISDPRQCTFSATSNICGKPGAPAAPNCVSPAQAAAFDRMWDGPRNKYGLRVWFPYEKSIPFNANPFSGLTIPTDLNAGGLLMGLATQDIKWNHKNPSFDPNNLYVDAESLALAGNPPNGITYEDEATLGANTVADYIDNQTPVLNKAASHGTKVIQIHGTADAALFWRMSADYYRRVATWYGNGEANFEKLQNWYRFFPIPDIGHVTGALGGGVGPSPVDPFPTLVNWVENGAAPASIPALAAGIALDPGRTRPLCPYPQTAIYNGSGSTEVASNFHCGGNLETPRVVCDDARTVYKHENGSVLDLKSIGVAPGRCEHHEADRDHDHHDHD
jgi:Tannase and feruloyl esterase